MLKNRITKEDGRYLIFYTFEEDPSPDESTIDGDEQSESKEDHPVRDND